MIGPGDELNHGDQDRMEKLANAAEKQLNLDLILQLGSGDHEAKASRWKDEWDGFPAEAKPVSARIVSRP